ncbi:hypothetical protein MAPG_06409 [Magnaporthiopsis poae ATCC 64411]|uniref:Uncharacterized protein n=1 Tax=Magnaporthiopsis poae (strain ATCC 64411 / 73-15) TaxID=644358 RepID=A0A0C4E1Y4_MAGP6|nr:hypothetical protein MAPG_06409 [Magnaporthiopsis poae ATCC 64411]
MTAPAFTPRFQARTAGTICTTEQMTNAPSRTIRCLFGNAARTKKPGPPRDSPVFHARAWNHAKNQPRGHKSARLQPGAVTDPDPDQNRSDESELGHLFD